MLGIPSAKGTLTSSSTWTWSDRKDMLRKDAETWGRLRLKKGVHRGPEECVTGSGSGIIPQDSLLLSRTYTANYEEKFQRNKALHRLRIP